MKNKIKKLSWMLLVLMCLPSVFAFSAAPPVYRFSLPSPIILVLLSVPIANLVIKRKNKKQINTLSSDEKEMFIENERVLKSIDFKREKVTRYCIGIWATIVVLFFISLIKHAGYEIIAASTSIIDMLIPVFLILILPIGITIFHFLEKRELYLTLNKNRMSNNKINNLSAKIRLGYTLDLMLANAILLFLYEYIRVVL